MMRQGAARIAVLVAAALSTGCAGLRFGLANAPTYVGSLKRLADQAYGPGPREKLDVYAPAAARNLPVVIFWHGGGWTGGSRGAYRFVGAALASRGLVAVLPDYSLYPEARFPGFLREPARAVAWVQQHAREFGGDPHCIVLMGHSAGAYMGAFLAYRHSLLREAGANPDWICGFVGLSGPYVLNPNTKVLNAIFAAPSTLQDWQPARFVDAKAPPTLLIHGLDDEVVEPAQSAALEAALKNAGVPVSTVFVPHRSHADTVASFAWVARSRTPALQLSVEFVNSVKQTGRSP